MYIVLDAPDPSIFDTLINIFCDCLQVKDNNLILRMVQSLLTAATGAKYGFYQILHVEPFVPSTVHLLDFPQRLYAWHMHKNPCISNPDYQFHFKIMATENAEIAETVASLYLP